MIGVDPEVMMMTMNRVKIERRRQPNQLRGRRVAHKQDAVAALVQWNNERNPVRNGVFPMIDLVS